MALQSDKLFKYSFAQNGDKKDIPVEPSQEGFVSISEGYPSDYQKDPLAGGKYVERDAFNGVLNVVTEPIKVFQNNGFPRLYDPNITNDTGYQRGASCGVWVDIVTGLVNPNANDWNCVLIRAVSLIDDNKISPYDIGAFNGFWWIDDGTLVGEVRSFQKVLQSPPTGYLPLCPADDNPNYLLSDYPRIQQLLLSGKIGTGDDYFKKVDDAHFTILNPRGRFPREWSNGSTIDNGRIFATLQGDAIRNLTGDIAIADVDGYGGQYFLNAVPSLVSGSIVAKPDTSKTGIDAGGAGKTSFMPSLDTSKQVPTTDTITGENRPYNYNRFSFIKI